MAATGNYTEEEKEKLFELYEKYGSENLQEVAEQLGKSVPSVRSKLVKEGVYVRPEKPSNRKKTGLAKKEILNEMEKLGVPTDVVDGLLPSKKTALNGLYEYILAHTNGVNEDDE